MLIRYFFVGQLAIYHKTLVDEAQGVETFWEEGVDVITKGAVGCGVIGRSGREGWQGRIVLSEVSGDELLSRGTLLEEGKSYVHVGGTLCEDC